MKKTICSVLAMVLFLASAYSEKSRFYENGKVIDTMYVNSREGLRIRTAPTLSASKIALLQDRIGVKVIAVGPEVTIDGITAPWIEILLPRYEWHGFEPEYGWIFGGYLEKKQKAFSTVGWTNADFSSYLSRYAWIETKSKSHAEILHFENDGTLRRLYEEMGAGGFGKWSCNFGNRTVTTKTVFYYDGDDDVTPEEHVETLHLESIGEYSFSIKGTVYVPRSEYRVLYDENYFREQDSDSRNFNSGIAGFMRLYYSSPVLTGAMLQKKQDLADTFIKYGLANQFDSVYMEKYSAYWDPIMKEHQAKADSMK